METLQGWHVGNIEYEYAGMPIRSRENDEKKWPHGVRTVSDIGHGRALGGARAVQLCYHAQIRRPRWIASSQYHGTPEHAIPDGRPLEDLRVDTTSPKRQVRGREKAQQQTSQDVTAIL